ncbi:MAG TPA: hypothetical protein VMW63_08015 [Methanoregulaceae archaeon]|nr:hypothetical protein [Methanoregulaceae archaeon]
MPSLNSTPGYQADTPARFYRLVYNVFPETIDMDKTFTCPGCGKPTLHAEFPDQYEVWLKCPSCAFFLGMSHDEWHRMQNSPNINEKIRKMAEKKK